MTVTLPSDDRRKLVGILSRPASDHDGERAAAGLLATRLLKARGLGWDEVIGLALPAPRRDPWTSAPPPQFPWRNTAAMCRGRPDLLSARELEFLNSLHRWTGALRPKQAAWLERIAAKVSAAEANA